MINRVRPDLIHSRMHILMFQFLYSFILALPEIGNGLRMITWLSAASSTIHVISRGITQCSRSKSDHAALHLAERQKKDRYSTRTSDTTYGPSGQPMRDIASRGTDQLAPLLLTSGKSPGRKKSYSGLRTR